MTITFKNGRTMELTDVEEDRLASMLTTYINMRETLVEPPESVQPSPPPKPTLDDVKAWARENREWVAWDSNKRCWSYKNKPWIGGTAWRRQGGDENMCRQDAFSKTSPGVPWHESLIAPDGRMLSVDPPKPKRKKRTEWKVGDSVRLNGNLVIGSITAYMRIYDLWYVRPWTAGIGGWYFIQMFDPTFPRNARRPTPKAPKLRRGMLCAMWDEGETDDCYPVFRAYFGKDKMGYISCERWERNVASTHWTHCVPYRPEFEGATIGEIKAILAKEAPK